MKNSILVLAMLIGSSAFIFNSCSKSSDTTPAVTTPPSPVAGSWQRSNGSAILVLAFNTDYTYAVISNGTSVESGTYSIAAPVLTLNAGTTTGCFGKPGKYNYAISTIGTATVLALTLSSDSCTSRPADAVGSWNKQ